MKPRVWPVLGAITLLFSSLSTGSYEDQTHQTVTKRALEIARSHDASLPIEFDPEGKYGAQVIAGAGRGKSGWFDSNAGEDYTAYVLLKCPTDAKPYWWLPEPLSHFDHGMFGAASAYEKFIQFYVDAVYLWKHDKRPEAAFILGRALHLFEEMAQPQHAMDENHMPHFVRTSFVEEEVEAD